MGDLCWHQVEGQIINQVAQSRVIKWAERVAGAGVVRAETTDRDGVVAGTVAAAMVVERVAQAESRSNGIR